MSVNQILEPVDRLKVALQEFVEAAQPENGLAYLLNEVDEEFFVPIACSQKHLLENVPHYLLFSTLNKSVVSNLESLFIEEKVTDWLSRGRLESLFFSNCNEVIYQQYICLADKHGHSLLLVRSAPSKPPTPLPTETARLCIPLMSLVFKWWSFTEYQGVITAPLKSGTTELLEVVKRIVRVLDDRDSFPPYWPFSYFSLEAISGNSSVVKVGANPLGLARWAIKELSPSRPWIKKMALLDGPAWEDIQLNAAQNKEYEKAINEADETAQFLLRELKDWIVPVCKFNNWQFFARHNKKKNCNVLTPTAFEVIETPTLRLAIAQILNYSEQTGEKEDADNISDFLLTLWALEKDGEQITDTVPIGGRVGSKLESLNNAVLDIFPQPFSCEDSRSKIKIGFLPIPGYETIKIKAQLDELGKQALSAMKKINPQAYLKELLAQVLLDNAEWNDFFPSHNRGSSKKRYHYPCDWKCDCNSDFDSLCNMIDLSLCALIPVLKYSKAELPGYNIKKNQHWCLHIAKGFNRGGISPEFVALVAGKFINFPKAYKINSINETAGDQLSIASDILYGLTLLARSSSDAFTLVECHIRTERAVNEGNHERPLLVLRFESEFKAGHSRKKAIAAAFANPESDTDGDEFRRACRVLERHVLTFVAGNTNRWCEEENGDVLCKEHLTLVLEFPLEDIDGTRRQ